MVLKYCSPKKALTTSKIEGVIFYIRMETVSFRKILGVINVSLCLSVIKSDFLLLTLSPFWSITIQNDNIPIVKITQLFIDLLIFIFRIINLHAFVKLFNI